MKKLVSVLCVLMLVIGMLAVGAIGANAADPAMTAVDVVAGDEVTYTLILGGVEEPVIGCDFSFYYDPDLLELSSVADFTGETTSTKWRAMINPDLDGEVRGNWSILQGVDFDTDRNFVTLTFKATAEGTAHISYYIRYMYDNNIFESEDKPQITEYKFTCDVKVNGETVLEKAEPELNVEETQTNGLFVNSVTGDSVDADPAVPGAVANADVAAGNSGSSGGSNSGTPANANANANTTTGGAAVSDDQSVSDGEIAATTAEGYYITATDAQGNVTATSDQAPVTAADPAAKSNSSALWIIIVLVVLAGGGAAAYFFMKKKPNNGTDAK